jgi:hypothetical protein
MGGALRGVWATSLLLAVVAGTVRADEPPRDLPAPRVIRGSGTEIRPVPPAPPAPPAPREPRVRARDGVLPPPRVRVLRGARRPTPTAPPSAVTPPRATVPPRDDAPVPIEETMISPRPTPPPERPKDSTDPRPEDIVFEVERPRGKLQRLVDAQGRTVYVMMGNPTVTGFEHRRADGRIAPAMSIKANVMVVWVDADYAEPLRIVQSMRESAESMAAGTHSGDPTRTAQSILEDAVLGIYAEGAVELRYGDLTFRAERLHIEPRTYQALLVRPRFEGLARGAARRGGDLPLYVRAQRARLVSKGRAVFDNADVGMSLASDRMELRVRTLTVEELEDGTDPDSDEDPNLLGFRNKSAQTYRAVGSQLRGERLPLFYWPTIEFGHPEGESFPVGLRRVVYGNRSTLGQYLLVGIGGVLGPSQDPLFDWRALLGGYVKKGPAAGMRLVWRRPNTYGKIEGWGVYDFDGEDFNDFVPPDEFRWRLNAETRTRIVRGLTFDAEYHQFSDENVNLEYWENDQLTHKDYESYGRLRYQRDPFVATLLGKWHERDFVTETTRLPEAALWVSSLPLMLPARRGGPGIDLTSVSRVSLLERRHAEGAPETDYRAGRVQTDTRANLGFSLGDARISSYAGVAASHYFDRSQGLDDLTRAAVLAGARANLQLHRTWEARGGPFQLDRIRHVVDVDAELQGRWYVEDDDEEAAPFFDLTDQDEERSAGILRVRNRLQTRGSGGGVRDVLDLELAWHHFVDDVGPWGLEGPGEITYQLRAQPRERLFMAGEGRWDLGRNDFYRASIGLGAQVSDRVAFFTGYEYVRGEAAAPFVDLSWRWSEKYGLRVLEQYDYKNRENRTRIVLGRYSADHTWFVGISLRGTDDVGFEFNFQPTIGTGGRRGRMVFNDQPSLDRWGLFRGN